MVVNEATRFAVRHARERRQWRTYQLNRRHGIVECADCGGENTQLIDNTVYCDDCYTHFEYEPVRSPANLAGLFE